MVSKECSLAVPDGRTFKSTGAESFSRSFKRGPYFGIHAYIM